ncbi:hypothetical protein SAMN06296386_106148 [Lachnospiraceae bacterium]|nr:hypothetical protein SAMN06296386_106148 [Lachnospiraceae bacterium]
MIFDGHSSKCKPDAKTIVSKDKGSPRKHIATNPNQKFSVRQFQLDGDIFKYVPCCDYLLLNDTSQVAYYIELKGKDVGHAAEQLQAAEKLCHNDLEGYDALYRIVASGMPTHKSFPLSYRKLLNKVGNKLKSKTGSFTEDLY